MSYNTSYLKYTWNGHVGNVTCFIYSEYATWSTLCTECFTKKILVNTCFRPIIDGIFPIVRQQYLGHAILTLWSFEKYWLSAAVCSKFNTSLRFAASKP